MNKKNYFSENLAYARKLKGFRQYELADWIGVRPNTISNYEKGVSEPDYDTLGKLKTVLKVSAEDLVFARPEKFKEVYMVLNPIKGGTVPVYGTKSGKKRYMASKIQHADADFSDLLKIVEKTKKKAGVKLKDVEVVP